MRQAHNQSRVYMRLAAGGADGRHDQADGFHDMQQDLGNLFVIDQPSHFARAPGQANG
jgi:hypothetical protein